MQKYISGFKNNSDSGFAARYAQRQTAENTVNKELLEKEQFKVGFEKGEINYVTAKKFMKIASCGCDRYLDEDSNTIWKKEGDKIIRINDDLSWVDEFLRNKED